MRERADQAMAKLIQIAGDLCNLDRPDLGARAIGIAEDLEEQFYPEQAERRKLAQEATAGWRA